MKKNPRRKQYKIMSIDPYLQPFYSDVALRMQCHVDVRQLLLGTKADLSSFANGYMYYGFLRTPTGWVFREWAPGADEIHLIGDFNDWNRTSHPLKKLESACPACAFPSEAVDSVLTIECQWEFRIIGSKC